MKNTIKIIIMTILIAGCPQNVQRQPCDKDQPCPAGQLCAPNGFCGEECVSPQDCLSAEQCQPSVEVAAGGPRYCIIPCESNKDCYGHSDKFDGTIECREVVYPPSNGAVSAKMCSSVNGGTTGEADDSGE